MASRKRYPATRRDATTPDDIHEAGPNTHNDVERRVRRTLRKQAWADGFLTSNGVQIPLFVRPVHQLK